MSMDNLTEMYKLWCAREGLPLISADQQTNLTPCQEEWRQAFVILWDEEAEASIPDVEPPSAWRKVLLFEVSPLWWLGRAIRKLLTRSTRLPDI